MTEAVTKYLQELQTKFKTGHAREHAYRPALQRLVEEINTSITAVNDPKQQKVGAPDFVLLKNKTPIGYIEAKDLDIDLDKEFKTKNQFNRYKSSLNNLCFTNYLDFIFYVNNEEVQRIQIARLVDKKIEILEENIPLFESVFKNFTKQKGISIRSPKELASLMAEKAKMLKNVIYLALKQKNEKADQIETQFEVFKDMLIRDLSHEQYSDIYAQTVAYGMFAARYHDTTMDSFSRDEAGRLLPKSNPFLRNFFDTITGINIDERIVWIVDDLAELFNHVDVRELLANYGKETKRTDAIVHFYETFLAEYDSKMRKSRGVYYTPEPVVDFMVRAVDDILKTEFGITDGLADTTKIEVKKEVVGKKNKEKVMEHRVQILDPATGTGTFLDQIIKHIYNSKFKGQEGVWQSYVDEHLLPRLHGFELLMASYAMAHLKLDITLAETGYDVSKGKGKRLGVYLTNSLEEPEAHQVDLFSQWLTAESLEANEVKKEKPIMVVIGNPPYSGISTNKGKWISDLIEDYKYVDGVHFGEKKHWLQDDYVKFIRFAQYFVEKNEEGIVAFINPHGFLDNPTFRGMRWKLQSVFDKIYTIDLHGNSKKKETALDGSKDENVFDIQQGVSINFFIKKRNESPVKNNKLADVYHLDLYGKRNKKYEFLKDNAISSIRWDQLKPTSPQYYFVPKDFELLSKYEEGFKLNDLFTLNSTGIVTGIDKLSIFKTIKELEETTQDILDCEDPFTKYSIKDTRKISKEERLVDLQKAVEYGVQKISYRPFDDNYMYLPRKNEGWINSPRYEVMQHFLNGENVGLVFRRQQPEANDLYLFVASHITADGYIRSDNKGGETISPLYLYQSKLGSSELERVPNLNMEMVNKIASDLKLTFIPDHEHSDSGKGGTFNPLDILDYIYAVLHSPTYRERYKEFLKIDFPRVPFTSDKKVFWAMVEKGGELRQYHLMEHKESSNLITKFPISGENEVVGAPKFENGKVWINETQYFENVPEIAWNFYIGGYQPAQKWLKDRKGRKLSFEDVLHYQKIIVALVNTDRVMREVDGVWTMQ